MQSNFSANMSQQNICRIWILFSVLLLLAYSNSFQAAWQFDDHPNILKNPKQQITKLSLNQIWGAMTAHPDFPESERLNRPIARISLGLNWLYGQDNVTGYHIINFLIHLGNSGLLFLVITSLYLTPRLKKKFPQGRITFIAITATLFWALNPIQIQAVTYIVQRMSSLAAFFSLTALLCYINARLTPVKLKSFFLFTCALTSYILAFLSKENACTLPLTIPFLELSFFQHTFSHNFLRSLFIKIILPLCFILLISLAFTPYGLDFIQDLNTGRPFTIWERFLTEQRIIVFYLSLLFFPHPTRLSIQHDIFLSTSLVTPISTLLALSFNVLLFFLALKIYRRQPLFTFAVIFFYINHISESTILPLELFFEHRNYLPSLFLFLPLAQLFAFLLEKNKKNILITTFITLILTTSFTTLAYATFARNKAWQTVESLWEDAAIKAPHSIRPLLTLGVELGWHGNPTKTKLQKSLLLHQKLQNVSPLLQKNHNNVDSKIVGNLAILYAKLGDIDKSITIYDEALHLNPDIFQFRYNLATYLLWKGNFKRARIEILRVLDSGYYPSGCWEILALIDMWTDHPDKALVSLQKALKITPNKPSVMFHLGKCLSMLGHHKRANFFYKRARNAGGRNAVLTLCRIENLLLNGDIIPAKEALRQALVNYPYPTLIQPLRQEKTNKRYYTIPIDTDLLKAFIASELLTQSKVMNNAEQ